MEINYNNPEIVIHDNQIEALLNTTTFNFTPLNAREEKYRVILDIPMIQISPRIHLLIYDFPAALKQFLKTTATTTAKLICSLDNARVKLATLQQHRKNHTWPEDITRSISISKDANDQLPNALGNLRTAALNMQICNACVKYSELDNKIQTMLIETANKICTVIKATTKWSDLPFKHQTVTQSYESIRITTGWKTFTDLILDTISQFTLKRLVDIETSTEKKTKFEELRAQKEQQLNTNVTNKSLDDALKRLQSQIDKLNIQTSNKKQQTPKQNASKSKSKNPKGNVNKKRNDNVSNKPKNSNPPKRNPPRNGGKRKPNGGNIKSGVRNNKGRRRELLKKD
jgi:hypothetical protein